MIIGGVLVEGEMMNKAKTAWSNVTNKITYEKLMAAWKKKYGTSDSVDSVDVEHFLRSRGVEQNIINKVFRSMGLVDAAGNTAE
jgi:hypothetical protein